MLVAWQQLRRFCNGPASVTPAAEPRTCAVSAARLKQISINRANAVNHQVKTLIHELAHALMRLTDPDGPELIYVKEEVVVESIAFNVVSGLGTTPRILNPVPGLLELRRRRYGIVEACAELIDRHAKRIENAIGDPPNPAAASESAEPRDRRHAASAAGT